MNIKFRTRERERERGRKENRKRGGREGGRKEGRKGARDRERETERERDKNREKERETKNKHYKIQHAHHKLMASIINPVVTMNPTICFMHTQSISPTYHNSSCVHVYV